MFDFFNDPNANFALDMMMVDELSKPEEQKPQPKQELTRGGKILLCVIGAIIGIVVGLVSALH